MTNSMNYVHTMADLDYDVQEATTTPPVTAAAAAAFGNGFSGSGAEKRLRTLPPAECLPRHEVLGGYIFVCNNETMEDDLRRQLFGLPARYRDSVRAIQPGLPLFLYNYSTHQLHGIFEVCSSVWMRYWCVHDRFSVPE